MMLSPQPFTMLFLLAVFLFSAGHPPATAAQSPDPLFDLVYIEGGYFQMGSSAPSAKDAGLHLVFVDDFYLSPYEVTQQQWLEIMESVPSFFGGCWNCPVEQVSWIEVQRFLKKLNAQTNLGRYRLPTEAEWEYAARAHEATRYAGSNDLQKVAWCEKTKTNKRSHPVGQKQANAFGLFDMSGNVREWCRDYYDAQYYANSPKRNPSGPSVGYERVVRGGSWDSWPRYCAVNRRSSAEASVAAADLGFRLVWEPFVD